MCVRGEKKTSGADQLTLTADSPVGRHNLSVFYLLMVINLDLCFSSKPIILNQVLLLLSSIYHIYRFWIEKSVCFRKTIIISK